MADPAPAPITPEPSIPAAPGAGPWHSGVDAETIGFWQNKGWTPDNPKDLATNITKSYREMEKHFGTTADQLLKMPKADANPADIKAFWQRLGAPQDAKDYEFNVKFNGNDLEESFVNSLRDAYANANLPKDKASAITAAVVKYLESADASETTLATAKLAEEKAALARNWGTNFDFNHLKAMEGVRLAGVTPETVKALENQMGYAGVMEHFRRIGAGTSEDMWVDRGASPNNMRGGIPSTRAGAKDELERLLADKAWGERLTSGNREAHDQWMGLLRMIEGDER